MYCHVHGQGYVLCLMEREEKGKIEKRKLAMPEGSG